MPSPQLLKPKLLIVSSVMLKLMKKKNAELTTDAATMKVMTPEHAGLQKSLTLGMKLLMLSPKPQKNLLMTSTLKLMMILTIQNGAAMQSTPRLPHSLLPPSLLLNSSDDHIIFFIILYVNSLIFI